jgi:hypothetical protein
MKPGYVYTTRIVCIFYCHQIKTKIGHASDTSLLSVRVRVPRQRITLHELKDHKTPEENIGAGEHYV